MQLSHFNPSLVVNIRIVSKTDDNHHCCFGWVYLEKIQLDYDSYFSRDFGSRKHVERTALGVVGSVVFTYVGFGA